jgi:hypothetical protein
MNNKIIELLKITRNRFIAIITPIIMFSISIILACVYDSELILCTTMIPSFLLLGIVLYFICKADLVILDEIIDKTIEIRTRKWMK